MKNRELNIELLKAYINGELNAKDSLLVEEQIANNEVWKDVYEGLLFASQETIDTRKTTEALFDKLDVGAKQPVKVIEMKAWKRWLTVAASLIGIVIVTYGTIQILRPQFEGEPEIVAQQTEQVFDGDQIEIIDSRPARKIPEQNFSEEEIRALDTKEPLTVNEKIEQLPAADEQREIIYPEDIEISKTAVAGSAEYENFLDRSGYRQVYYRPGNARNSRGPNGGSLPSNHFRLKSDKAEVAAGSMKINTEGSSAAVVFQNAVPDGDIEEFEYTAAADYIARFPFTGVVKIEFTIDEQGRVINYIVNSSDSQEMEEAVSELIRKRTEWQPAQNEAGEAVEQHLQAEISFGNTVYVRLNFVE